MSISGIVTPVNCWKRYVATAKEVLTLYRGILPTSGCLRLAPTTIRFAYGRHLRLRSNTVLPVRRCRLTWRRTTNRKAVGRAKVKAGSDGERMGRAVCMLIAIFLFNCDWIMKQVFLFTLSFLLHLTTS